jgi:hypothetical protein
VRRLNRAMTLTAVTAAVIVAALIAGCSSSTTAASTKAASTTQAQSGTGAAGYQYSQAMRHCLNKYGIKRTSLKQSYFGTGTNTVSTATLKTAGEQCWKSSATGLAASALRRIDSCMKVEGIPSPAATPLADVLVELEMHNQKVRSALRFCLRT